MRTLAAVTALAAVALPATPHPAAATGANGLDGTLRAVHTAGAFGAYSAVRSGDTRWRGAAGAADISTGRPMTPGLHHRVGSVTKSFVAVAVLRLVADGGLDLDSSVAGHLPAFVPEGLDPAVTVRMLLNHTSGIANHGAILFPAGDPAALDRNRFRTFTPGELARLALRAPRTGPPGDRYAYSNTNYVLAGLLLEHITGTGAQRHITEHVIRPTGLKDTYFPRTPFVEGPHARMYDSGLGAIDPPRDYSVYDMSWAWAAGDLVSTMDDLTRFHRALFDGTLLPRAQLAAMTTTVPATDPLGDEHRSGLGLAPRTFSCGTFWGYRGGTWGAYTLAYASADGRRQAAVGINRMQYWDVNDDGTLRRHPVDTALDRHLDRALCGARPGGR
ncbi:serine hydrolase domain-containing protein [Streptomyces tsukubensis]